MKPTNAPDRELSLLEQEIYHEAREAVTNYKTITMDKDKPSVFQHSARAEFQRIARKVGATIEQQYAHCTDMRIRSLGSDLSDMGHTGFNDVNRLGQAIETCLFDQKFVPNPLLRLKA